MAAVLAATGLFLYLRLQSGLDHTLNQGLRSRTSDITALVQQSDTGLRDAARTSGRTAADFAQILDRSGRVFDGTTGLQRRPLLGRSAIARARNGPTTVDLPSGAPVDGAARILTTPVQAQGRQLFVVAGVSLEARNQALHNLATLLWIGGSAALLLTALAGYGLASAALRPVEAMRARAAAISSDDLDQRLPLSHSRDELHRLGETLNEMLARLEAGLARERDFVAEASHELRTPLAMLRTELELIRRDRPTPDELDTAVGAAIADTDALSRLTDDLLLVASADRGQLPIRPERIQVGELLARVSRRYLGADVAPMDEGEPASDLELQADPARLEQALTNMVDNALRHGAAPVRLAAFERAGFVELHVRDAGPGFAPQFLPRAFERFARSDAGHTSPGTGLGLSIVAAIAERHGGFARASNLADGGADAWIAIPGGPTTDGDSAFTRTSSEHHRAFTPR